MSESPEERAELERIFEENNSNYITEAIHQVNTYQFRGVWIHADVWNAWQDGTLTNLEFLAGMIVDRYSTPTKVCNLTNKQIAKHLDISSGKTGALIQGMIEQRFLIQTTPEGKRPRGLITCWEYHRRLVWRRNHQIMRNATEEIRRNGQK